FARYVYRSVRGILEPPAVLRSAVKPRQTPVVGGACPGSSLPGAAGANMAAVSVNRSREGKHGFLPFGAIARAAAARCRPDRPLGAALQCPMAPRRRRGRLPAAVPRRAEGIREVRESLELLPADARRGRAGNRAVACGVRPDRRADGTRAMVG